MVFSSLPSYHDPDPPSWPHQQQPAGALADGVGDHDQIYQLPPSLLPPPLPPMGSGGAGRSLQILEPGRMAKLPHTDTAMKCPRCDSTNTKFCYFNNYSLSQPRHFCKTCRRYWTRGGALRNVPVGGGCRRNKKNNKGSRGSRSKSPSSATTSSTSNNPMTHPDTYSPDLLGHLSYNTRPPPHALPMMPPLHHFGGGDLGLTYGDGNGTDLFNLGHDHDPRRKFAHFPIIEAANDHGIMYGSEGPSNYGGQDAGMKMEDNQHQQQHQGILNLSRNFLGVSGDDQFMAGTSNVAWGTTDHGGFNSTSTTTATTTHLL